MFFFRPGFLLGQTPASIWYWCADQVYFGSPEPNQAIASWIEKSEMKESPRVKPIYLAGNTYGRFM